VVEVGLDRQGQAWSSELTATRVVRVEATAASEESAATWVGVELAGEPLDLVIDHSVDDAATRRDLDELLGRIEPGGEYVVGEPIGLDLVVALALAAVERPDVVAWVRHDASGTTTITRGTAPTDRVRVDELGSDPFGIDVFGADAC